MRSAIIAALALRVIIPVPALAQPAERPRVELMVGTAWWALHDLTARGPFTGLSTIEAGGTYWFWHDGSWGWSLRYVRTVGVSTYWQGAHPDTHEAISAFNGVTCTLRYRRRLGNRVGFEIGGGFTTGRFDNLVRTSPTAPWEYVHVEGDRDNLASGVLIGEAVLDIPLSQRFKIKTGLGYYSYFDVGWGEYGPALVPVAFGVVGF